MSLKTKTIAHPMSVVKLRGRLQDYFEHMTDKTIEMIAIFDGELVIFLDDGSEVCIFQNDDGLAMQINEEIETDD
jgi:hypothetical protein